jgi:CheY-like chemotaxis protein
MEHPKQESLARFAAAREAETPSKMIPGYPGRARPTILVADDFDDSRLLLRTWLERRGFRVIEAENGCEAVFEAESESPDLIIMDLEMPELDGLEATRAIRRIQRLANVPILAVSAYGAEQYRGLALRAGCNEYVSTPFEPAQLESLIRSYMH